MWQQHNEFAVSSLTKPTMPFISTNTWVLKILDGTMSHKMKALGGYALYDEAFAGAREDAQDH